MFRRLRFKRVGRSRLRVGGVSSTAVLRAVSSGIDSITMPAGYAAGDLLVLLVQNGNPTIAGWNKTDLATGVDGKASVYTKTSNGTEGTVVMGAPSVDFMGDCFAFSAFGSGLEASAAGTAGGSTPIVAPTVTSGGASRYLISGYLTLSNWSITVPGGQTPTTSKNTFNSVTARCGYEVVGAGATGTRTATAAGMGTTKGFSLLIA